VLQETQVLISQVSIALAWMENEKNKKREESKCIREHRGTTSRVSWWHLKFLKEEPNP